MKNALDLNSRIVGGSEAESPIPWQVRWNDCGGTILDEYTILTAAHCGTNSYRRVLAGALSLQNGFPHDPPAQKIQVKKNIMHYKWNGDFTSGYDYSILKLREPLTFNKNIKPACLPEENFAIGDFAFALASGWGKNGKILIIPFQKLS